MSENTIDTLMDLMDTDPLLLQPKDINAIIAYHRKARARQVEGGARPKRESGPKLDITAIRDALTGGPQPKAPTVKRRV